MKNGEDWLSHTMRRVDAVMKEHGFEEDFELKGIPVFIKETGVWAACWACCQFVDAAKWAALTKRAFQKYVRKYGVPRHHALGLRPQFEDMVRKFAEHKLSEC
jgi:hypothetical protein